jgi:superfamily II DNA/RNA helicase
MFFFSSIAMSRYSKDTEVSSEELVDRRIIMEIAGIIESNWDELPIEHFGAMNLKDKLLRGIFSVYEKPSAIQQRSIVPIIKRRDVIIQAQSCESDTLFKNNGL